MNEFEKYISEYSYERLINLRNDMLEYCNIYIATDKLSTQFAVLAVNRLKCINKRIRMIDGKPYRIMEYW